MKTRESNPQSLPVRRRQSGFLWKLVRELVIHLVPTVSSLCIIAFWAPVPDRQQDAFSDNNKHSKLDTCREVDSQSLLRAARKSRSTAFCSSVWNFSLYSFAFPCVSRPNLRATTSLLSVGFFGLQTLQIAASALRSFFFLERSFPRVPRLVVLLRGSERGWAVQKESDLWTTGTCSIKLIKWPCWIKNCRASGHLRLRI